MKPLECVEDAVKRERKISGIESVEIQSAHGSQWDTSTLDGGPGNVDGEAL